MAKIPLFHIDFSITHYVGDETYNEFPCVEVYNGVIHYHDDANARIDVGEIEIHLYDHMEADGSMRCGLFHCFDRSRSTIDMGEALLDEDSDELLDDIEDTFDSTLNSGILIIHEFMLLAPFRGKGYGASILKGIEQRFAYRCRLFALKAYPKQFDLHLQHNRRKFEKYGMDSMKSMKETTAVNKLNSFYKSCGFKKLKRSSGHYFVKSL